MEMKGNDAPRSGRWAGALVSYLMATDTEFVDRHLTARDEQGNRVVVPVVDTDSVTGVAALVRQAGGNGSVVVCRATGQGTALAVATMTVNVGTSVGDWHVPVTSECTIGALIDILLPGASITLRADSGELNLGDISARDIDDTGAALAC